MGTANDMNQRWVLDMGLPGPDEGRGGTHVLLRPRTATATSPTATTRDGDDEPSPGALAGPAAGDDMAARDRRHEVREGAPPRGRPGGGPPVVGRSDQARRRRLHAGALGGQRAVLGCAAPAPAGTSHRSRRTGRSTESSPSSASPREPRSNRTTGCGTSSPGPHGSVTASCASSRSPTAAPSGRCGMDPVGMGGLRPENGTFDTPNYHDGYARQKWFYQAQIESPAMFRRSAGAGSLYWLGTRDATGAYLDGASPTRSPCRSQSPRSCSGRSPSMTWRPAARSPRTRTSPRCARCSSSPTSPTDQPVALHFGPDHHPTTTPPRWIKTKPGTGWFVYFRIYGPEPPTFDGTWQLPDFQPVT